MSEAGNMSFNQPTLANISLSISIWFLVLVGGIIIRAESHPWVNVIMLTAIFPAFIWFASRNSILGSVSQGGLIATIIAAVLFMTLLLEARAKSKFSVGLKKNFKEFGKKPLDTAYASGAVMGSIMIGLIVSYAVLNKNFIEM
jgi:hypothetical protein